MAADALAKMLTTEPSWQMKRDSMAASTDGKSLWLRTKSFKWPCTIEIAAGGSYIASGHRHRHTKKDKTVA